jgi:hypothetical protein
MKMGFDAEMSKSPYNVRSRNENQLVN